MDANNIGRDFQRYATQLEHYVRDEMPRMVKRKVLRFIDGNFRAQGWQGRSFERWKETMGKAKGRAILIKTGKLRRSFHGDTPPYEAHIWSDSSYARAHNRGFNGTVQVKAYTRHTYTASQVGTGRFNKSGTERTKTVHQVTGMTQVQAHQRQMNIPKRQMAPEDMHDTPVLVDAIKKDAIKAIKNIFEH